MFRDSIKGSGNPDPQEPNDNIQSQLNLNQKKDFDIEDIPIRTMRKDLKNLSNPDFKANANIPEAAVPRRTAETVSGNRSNPFLNQRNWAEKETLKLKEDKPIHHTLGKLAIAAIIAFIFLAMALGGYYFWITRTSDDKLAEDIPIPLPSSPETLPAFAAGKPNYLNMDIETYDKDQVRKIFKNYAAKVSEMKTVPPIEFIITDTDNNPVNFSSFAQKSGLTFSDDILFQLNSDFSLYIYNDRSGTRLGLSISVKDPEQLKINILKEEKNLAKGLEALYLASAYTLPEDKYFDSATYNTAAIRYLNITSPEDLSVDYTVYNNQLVIGTTKSTLRSIIDYIDRQNGQSVDNLWQN